MLSRKRVFFLLTILAILSLDQVSKFLAVQQGFVTELNSKYIFGIISLPIAVYLILFGFGLFILIFWRREKVWLHSEFMGWALCLGGSLSNGMDRISAGYVKDFISLGNLTTCNLADIFLIMGAIIIFYNIFIFPSLKPQV